MPTLLSGPIHCVTLSPIETVTKGNSTCRVQERCLDNDYPDLKLLGSRGVRTASEKKAKGFGRRQKENVVTVLKLLSGVDHKLGERGGGIIADYTPRTLRRTPKEVE